MVSGNASVMKRGSEQEAIVVNSRLPTYSRDRERERRGNCFANVGPVVIAATGAPTLGSIPLSKDFLDPRGLTRSQVDDNLVTIAVNQ